MQFHNNNTILQEPHDNGPLFVEMHFYMRNAKLDDIRKFQQSKGIKSLGMPYMVGNGSIEINGVRHRFIVLPRYGSDVNKFFLANNRRLPEGTVYRIAIQMLEVFEFIHDSGYVHADLKAANILLENSTDGTAKQVYLLDFGLASHYTTKDFKPDPKKMHNGTIEYTSRDAHLGVATMRSDLEILGYNLIEWLGGQLPWVQEKLLTTAVKVQKSKENFMANLKTGLKSAFPSKNVPQALSEYLDYVKSLEYNERPDYSLCKKVFQNSLKLLKINLNGKLDFHIKATDVSVMDNKKTKLPTGAAKNRKLYSKNRSKEESEDDNESNNDDSDEVVAHDSDRDIFESEEPVKRRKVGNVRRKEKTTSKETRKQVATKRNALSKALDTTVENTINSSFDGESGDGVVIRHKDKSDIIQKLAERSSPAKRHRQPLHNFYSDATINDSMSKSLNKSTDKRSDLMNEDRGQSDHSPVTEVSSKTRSGRTIINNNIPKKKSNKTYEFNFELDVSVDANVVVNVKRKGEDGDGSKVSKAAKTATRSTPTQSSSTSSILINGEKTGSSGKGSTNTTPLPRVRVQKFQQAEDGRSPQQQPIPELKLRRIRR